MKRESEKSESVSKSPLKGSRIQRRQVKDRSGTELSETKVVDNKEGEADTKTWKWIKPGTRHLNRAPSSAFSAGDSSHIQGIFKYTSFLPMIRANV